MSGRGAAAAGGARGGGGGGGRGRGRGGSKPSVFTPQLLGGLEYNDIISQSKEGTDVLYPVSLCFSLRCFRELEGAVKLGLMAGTIDSQSRCQIRTTRRGEKV